MATASVNGIELHYQIDGPDDAPPLLFSNSLGTNIGMWDRETAALSKFFRIVRYDSRGHGRSGAPHEDYNIDQLAHDALGLLDHLGIERTYYCGLSKGGMVGQWLGRNAPERLHRMVLANTSPHMSPPGLWDQRIGVVREGGMEAITPSVIERWFTSAFLEDPTDDLERVRQMLLTTPPQGYVGCSAAIRDMDQRDGLADISVPTLVIVGEHDPATPPDHGEMIAARVPGAELAVIRDAAHLSNIEQPEQFMTALKGFLLG